VARASCLEENALTNIDIDAAAYAIERCRTVLDMTMRSIDQHDISREADSAIHYLALALTRLLAEVETALALAAPQNGAVGRAAA
jgi:hypothetical protein